MFGSATDKARSPRLCLVLGTGTCCDVDDLSCLGLFDRCRGLSRVVDVLHVRNTLE